MNCETRCCFVTFFCCERTAVERVTSVLHHESHPVFLLYLGKKKAENRMNFTSPKCWSVPSAGRGGGRRWWKEPPHQKPAPSGWQKTALGSPAASFLYLRENSTRRLFSTSSVFLNHFHFCATIWIISIYLRRY